MAVDIFIKNWSQKYPKVQKAFEAFEQSRKGLSVSDLIKKYEHAEEIERYLWAFDQIEHQGRDSLAFRLRLDRSLGDLISELSKLQAYRKVLDSMDEKDKKNEEYAKCLSEIFFIEERYSKTLISRISLSFYDIQKIKNKEDKNLEKIFEKHYFEKEALLKEDHFYEMLRLIEYMPENLQKEWQLFFQNISESWIARSECTKKILPWYLKIFYFFFGFLRNMMGWHIPIKKPVDTWISRASSRYHMAYPLFQAYVCLKRLDGVMNSEESPHETEKYLHALLSFYQLMNHHYKNLYFFHFWTKNCFLRWKNSLDMEVERTFISLCLQRFVHWLNHNPKISDGSFSRVLESLRKNLLFSEMGSDTASKLLNIQKTFDEIIKLLSFEKPKTSWEYIYRKLEALGSFEIRRKVHKALRERMTHSVSQAIDSTYAIKHYIKNIESMKIFFSQIPDWILHHEIFVDWKKNNALDYFKKRSALIEARDAASFSLAQAWMSMACDALRVLDLASIKEWLDTQGHIWRSDLQSALDQHAPRSVAAHYRRSWWYQFIRQDGSDTSLTSYGNFMGRYRSVVLLGLDQIPEIYGMSMALIKEFSGHYGRLTLRWFQAFRLEIQKIGDILEFRYAASELLLWVKHKEIPQSAMDEAFYQCLLRSDDYPKALEKLHEENDRWLCEKNTNQLPNTHLNKMYASIHHRSREIFRNYLHAPEMFQKTSKNFYTHFLKHIPSHEQLNHPCRIFSKLDEVTKAITLFERWSLAFMLGDTLNISSLKEVDFYKIAITVASGLLPEDKKTKWKFRLREARSQMSFAPLAQLIFLLESFFHTGDMNDFSIFYEFFSKQISNQQTDNHYQWIDFVSEEEIPTIRLLLSQPSLSVEEHQELVEAHDAVRLVLFKYSPRETSVLKDLFSILEPQCQSYVESWEALNEDFNRSGVVQR